MLNNIIDYSDWYSCIFFRQNKSALFEILGILIWSAACGTLENLMKFSTCQHDETHLVKLAFCILSALKSLGSLHLIHADIKPDNILIMHDGIFKLGDFSNTFRDDLEVDHLHGTANKACPEMLGCMSRKRKLTSKADIWSFGITRLDVAMKHHPLQSLDDKYRGFHFEQYSKIYANDVAQMKFSATSGYSQNFKILWCLCWSLTIEKGQQQPVLSRISYLQKLNHPSASYSMILQIVQPRQSRKMIPNFVSLMFPRRELQKVQKESRRRDCHRYPVFGFIIPSKYVF